MMGYHISSQARERILRAIAIRAQQQAYKFLDPALYVLFTVVYFLD
jgi:hypothetical protein